MQSDMIQCIGIESAGDYKLFKKVQIKQKKLAPRDILIQVKAVAVNPIDFKQRDSGGVFWRTDPYPTSSSNPLVLGYDAAGIVQECGSEVKFFKKGDEVYYARSINQQGSNAQFQVVDERIVGLKPKTLNWGQAAAIPLVALTAWEGMFEIMNIDCSQQATSVNKSKTILIVGGAGGVGCIAIQLAKLMGIGNVIATASRPETVKFCQVMGADHVINHTKSLFEEIQHIGVKEVDYMFVTPDITQKHIDEAAKIIKHQGKMVGITGFRNQLQLFPLLVKRITLGLELMFSKAILQDNMDSQRQILDQVSALYDSKTLKKIDQNTMKFNVENMCKAHQLQESGKTIGKIVLEDVDVFFKN